MKLYTRTIPSCCAPYHPEMCSACEAATGRAERCHNCEWCESMAIYRLKAPGYERFACSEHLDKTRRLAYLDGQDSIKETKRHRGWVMHGSV